MPRFFSFLLVSTWLVAQLAAAQPLSPAKHYVQRYTQAANRVTIALAENATWVQFTQDLRPKAAG